MTANPVLNSSLCVSTMLNNVPVVVTGIHMGNVGLLVLTLGGVMWDLYNKKRSTEAP
jgi:hypothetical protein